MKSKLMILGWNNIEYEMNIKKVELRNEDIVEEKN